jgi:hypothetical protein
MCLSGSFAVERSSTVSIAPNRFYRRPFDGHFGRMQTVDSCDVAGLPGISYGGPGRVRETLIKSLRG